MMKKKVGLIAGRGNLPFEVLREIAARDCQAWVVGLRGEVSPELSGKAERYLEIGAGNMGRIIEFFVSNQLTEIVFAGKVGKEAIFSNDGFDPGLIKMLQGLPQKNDDAILGAIVAEFERHGLTVARQTDYLRNLLVSPGEVIGELTPSEYQDVKLGFKMAKASGELDIGQSVLVKHGVVLAVEAIEGTDQAILRGGELGGPGAVVVKVSKPKQDERFDVPTVGSTTLESMITAGAKVLAIEANKTLLTQKETVLELAARHDIKIIAVEA